MTVAFAEKSVGSGPFLCNRKFIGILCYIKRH